MYPIQYCYTLANDLWTLLLPYYYHHHTHIPTVTKSNKNDATLVRLSRKTLGGFAASDNRCAVHDLRYPQRLLIPVICLLLGLSYNDSGLKVESGLSVSGHSLLLLGYLMTTATLRWVGQL
jgi:hypothetical protein